MLLFNCFLPIYLFNFVSNYISFDNKNFFLIFFCIKTIFFETNRKSFFRFFCLIWIFVLFEKCFFKTQKCFLSHVFLSKKCYSKRHRKTNFLFLEWFKSPLNIKKVLKSSKFRSIFYFPKYCGNFIFYFFIFTKF